MDFMNPKRRRRHNVMLLCGYVLIGIAVVLLTLVLLFVAYGFGYKDGRVIQNGLVFLSSTPSPAQVYIDGTRYKNDTNTRAVLDGGTYDVQLRRAGYRTWQRSITVQSGQVVSYTYPFLFPSTLTTTTKQDYAAAPAFMAQSPDQRWLLAARPGSLTSLDMYDLNSPQTAPTVIALPAGLLAAASSQTLQPLEWSGDGAYLLLRHIYDGNTEYILLDRAAPQQSLNLTKALDIATSGVEVHLNNKKYDQYLLLDTVSHTLLRATLEAPQPRVYLDHVLAFAAYGDGMVLYATPDTAASQTKTDIDLYDGSTSYLLRRAKANTTYLLALSEYDGNLYAALSASSEGTAYIYENPATQATNSAGDAAPVQVLRLASPEYVSFSAGGQYVVFENGTKFTTYDLENQQGFAYTVTAPLDTPQTHAFWMDGARLDYVSKGQIVVFDYDGQNRQTLVSSDARYQPYFGPSYKLLYTPVPSASDPSQELLTSTSLRTPADQ